MEVYYTEERHDCTYFLPVSMRVSIYFNAASHRNFVQIHLKTGFPPDHEKGIGLVKAI